MSASWHRVLLDDIRRDHPRQARGYLDVARTLCNMAAQFDSDRIFAGAADVAERAGYSQRHTKRVLDWLVLNGYLHRVKRGGLGRFSIDGTRKGGAGKASIFTLASHLLHRVKALARRKTRAVARPFPRNSDSGVRAIERFAYLSQSPEGGAEISRPPRAADSSRPWAKYLGGPAEEESAEVTGRPVAWREARGADSSGGNATAQTPAEGINPA